MRLAELFSISLITGDRVTLWSSASVYMCKSIENISCLSLRFDLTRSFEVNILRFWEYEFSRLSTPGVLHIPATQLKLVQSFKLPKRSYIVLKNCPAVSWTRSMLEEKVVCHKTDVKWDAMKFISPVYFSRGTLCCAPRSLYIFYFSHSLPSHLCTFSSLTISLIWANYVWNLSTCHAPSPFCEKFLSVLNHVWS